MESPTDTSHPSLAGTDSRNETAAPAQRPEYAARPDDVDPPASPTPDLDRLRLVIAPHWRGATDMAIGFTGAFPCVVLLVGGVWFSTMDYFAWPARLVGHIAIAIAIIVPMCSVGPVCARRLRQQLPRRASQKAKYVKLRQAERTTADVPLSCDGSATELDLFVDTIGISTEVEVTGPRFGYIGFVPQPVLWLLLGCMIVAQRVVGPLRALAIYMAVILLLYLCYRLKTRYYRIHPGRLDVQWGWAFRESLHLERSIDLTTADICCRFDKAKLTIAPAGPDRSPLVIRLDALAKPHAFAATVFAAALYRGPVHTLPPDRFVG